MTSWVLPLVVWVPLFALGGWCVLAGSPAHGERWLRGRLLERLPALGMWAASGSCMAAGLVFFSADEDVAEFLWIGCGFALAAIGLGIWYRSRPWWQDDPDLPDDPEA